MIRSGLIIMIKDLANKGKSAGAISREIGIAENTARKYMTQPAKPHGLKGTKKPSKLDPYKPYLQELMNQGIFNCIVLYERICSKGYAGGITILKEYVKPFRPAKSVPAFVMILGASRAKYVEFTSRVVVKHFCNTCG